MRPEQSLLSEIGNRQNYSVNCFHIDCRLGINYFFFQREHQQMAGRFYPLNPRFLQLFLTKILSCLLHIQPVSVLYTAPKDCDSRFYGWWGDMEFGTHFLFTLSRWRQGKVEIKFLPSVAIKDFGSRKEIAKHLESAVRLAHQSSISRSAVN